MSALEPTLLISCNFCHGETWDQVFDQQPDPVFNLLRCRACGLVRNEEIPDQQTLSGYYEDTYYEAQDAKKFWAPIEGIASFFRSLRYRRVAYGRHGSILDVGCGRGVMLGLFKRHGWEAAGTEVSMNALHAAEARGIAMRRGELPEAAFPSDSFDVVTMWHVLEHVRDPQRYLEEVRRIVKPGGLVVVEVPNFGSWAARVLRRHWFALELPRHLFHFSASLLRARLEAMGFAVRHERYLSIDPGYFSLLQSVLNWALGERNVLYDTLRTTRYRAPHGFGMVAASVFLAAVLALPLFLFMIFLVWRKEGDVVTLYAEKAEEGSRG